MDALDSRILRILSSNARIPIKELAEVCGISRAVAHQRVHRLFDEGVFLSSGFRVSPVALGYQVCTYIGIKLEKASRYKEVMPRLARIPELVECHFTTGPYTLLAKLYARDTHHLMQLLNGCIQEIPGVSETETLMSLDEPLNRGIALPDDDPS